MTQFLLFEDHGYPDLLPLVYWRSVFELNSGRSCLMDRITRSVGQHPRGLWARDWIAEVAAHRCQLPVNQPVEAGMVLLNARWLGSDTIDIKPPPFVGMCGDSVVYIACDADLAERLNPQVMLDEARRCEVLANIPSEEVDATLIRYPWDLVTRNADVLWHGWHSAHCAIDGDVSSAAYMLRPDLIHVGEGSVVRPTAVLDAQEGPIFLSNNVTVEPHTYLAGPLYIGPGAVIKAQATILGGTTIGPACWIGGEVNNCIISGYTRKSHEGYLGHSFIGNWVDIGPGTANTDLKTTYGPVRVVLGTRAVDTGLSCFGAIIADHVRIGTNQKIPNGAVVGFAASVATGRFLPKFLPSFAWYSDSGLASGDPERLLATARLAMASRNVDLTADEAELFSQLARRSEAYER
jgi:UDP-N-acetylglucosamine diphosphorylase/glucosamine-1-phosphate N-acetyltransferase